MLRGRLLGGTLRRRTFLLLRHMRRLVGDSQLTGRMKRRNHRLGFFAMTVRNARAEASSAAPTLPVLHSIKAKTEDVREFRLRHIEPPTDGFDVDIRSRSKLKEIRAMAEPSKHIGSSLDDFPKDEEMVAIQAIPALEMLRIISEESKRNGTSEPTSRQIDLIIKEARAQKK
jgi:hypothetical protein